jgi:hypothetical protein
MPYATSAEGGSGAPPGRWIAEDVWPSPRVRATQVDLPAARPGPQVCGGGAVVGFTKPEWLDRLPGEQSADDAQSLVFETAPLAADLEILGRPSLALRLSSDASAAHIAARLTEVKADGRSWLVAYALKNLAHRHSHETPAAMTPGVAEDVTLEMAFVAHRFGKGSRIRIAISESLWPLVWPSADGARVTLEVGDSGLALSLPVRPVEAEAAPFDIPERLSEAPAPALPLAPTTVDGRFVLESRSARGRREVAEIMPGNASSARWSAIQRSAWSGEGFDCHVEAGYELTADAGAFHLSEWLIAREGETVVFERRTSADVPRDL